MGRLDIVIPCSEKDRAIVVECARAVCRQIPEAGGVTMLTDEVAALMPFPFTRQDVELRVPADRAGWYYQQLLKLYAPIVLNRWLVLVVDADVVFLRKCWMLDPDGVPFYALGDENHRPYFEHIWRLLPYLMGLCGTEGSGVAHHMVFDRTVIEALFTEVEETHGKPFWQAFLDCIDPREAPSSGASEYEIYLHYMLLRHPEKGRIRPLKWGTVDTIRQWAGIDLGLDFVTVKGP